MYRAVAGEIKGIQLLIKVQTLAGSNKKLNVVIYPNLFKLQGEKMLVSSMPAGEIGAEDQPWRGLLAQGSVGRMWPTLPAHPGPRAGRSRGSVW